MKCLNCGNDLDYEYQVTENLMEMLENSSSKEELKLYLDTEFDWSINQACEKCYCTYWVPEEGRAYWYSTLEKL